MERNKKERKYEKVGINYGINREQMSAWKKR